MSVATVAGGLEFTFPQIAPDASMRVIFHRTLRVPDDESTYGLPPTLGHFDLSSTARDGIIMPMWQSEACWLSFDTRNPFLVMVGAGSVNAVTGEKWNPQPDFASENYFEVPTQPWLDGFCTGRGVVRQFVAMPLGQGYTAEEQLSDEPARGGIWLSVYPLRTSVWAQRSQLRMCEVGVDFCAPPGGMGLGAGGSIKQSIATPMEPSDNWDLTAGISAFVRTVNTEQWRSITGVAPHHRPATIEEYQRYGLPWFEWYDDSIARQGSATLASVSTVREVGEKKGHQSLPDNGSFDPPIPIGVGP
ncbi:hypothetical protein [Williamsia sp. CHRR-6]|uniref:hypothetical protein n=1 Tax=Williamsia sp. CHRR-6 TaxID=2835871 RepID=UPI001BD91399|nr:hypothetical protein [Williamsia sp. CHRR-6]MBT0566097.1 hypothetical protein [Williamsia sp. CHRR-6]